MESLLIVGAPVIVWLVTQGVKKIGVLDLGGGYKKTVTRLFVAILSFGSVHLSASLDGTLIEPTAVENLSQAIVTFLAATGTHFFTKKNS